MDVVTKSATVTTVESENPNGEFEVVLSTESLDRDNENLWADEWKQPLPERIHIDGDHGRTLEKTVGSAVPRIEGNRMVAKGTYAGTEYAQMVRQLVNEGHINSVSVTYAERKNQKDNSVQRELLNAAFVAIPANPEAVVLASKSAKVDTNGLVKALETLVDALTKAEGGLGASGDNPTVKHDQMVQAIHDAAYQLGAECVNDADADPGVDEGANKSVGAVYVDVVPRIKSPESSASKEVGSPKESAEESPAAAAKAAAAVDESAEDAAHVKAKEAEKARALAWLISQNVKD